VGPTTRPTAVTVRHTSVSHGPVTGQSRTSHGPDTGQSRASHGPVTGQSQASHEPVTGQSRASHGPVTGQFRSKRFTGSGEGWGDAGPDPARLLGLGGPRLAVEMFKV
jgi:hypothetical protein